MIDHQDNFILIPLSLALCTCDSYISFVFFIRFQYGIGTQVMLASTVYSPVREQILDRAQKLLANTDEVEALKRRLGQVHYSLYSQYNYVHELVIIYVYLHSLLYVV